MRKERKLVDMRLEQVSVERMEHFGFAPMTYTYEFKTHEPIDTETLECFVEVDVPETLAEFRQMNNLSKEELTEWLNKNYKHR